MTEPLPTHANIHVQLSDEDGNAFSIMARARKAARRGGMDAVDIEAFTAEATSGDYDHLLQTVMRWFLTS